MGLSNRVAGVLIAFFILGAIGPTAVVMAANQTAYEGAPAAVITLWTIGVVSIGAVAVMLYFIPRRAMAFVPQLGVYVLATKVHRLLKLFVKKIRRD